MVRTAIRELAQAQKAATVAAVRDEVAEALWQAAVQIEDGNLGDAAQRLAKAKERLQQALRERAPDEEIARLMDELRQATPRLHGPDGAGRDEERRAAAGARSRRARP